MPPIPLIPPMSIPVLEAIAAEAVEVMACIPVDMAAVAMPVCMSMWSMTDYRFFGLLSFESEGPPVVEVLFNEEFTDCSAFPFLQRLLKRVPRVRFTLSAFFWISGRCLYGQEVTMSPTNDTVTQSREWGKW